MDGDTIELETEGLGRLKFGVKDESQAQLGAQNPPPDARRGQGEDPGRLPDITPQLSGKYAK